MHVASTAAVPEGAQRGELLLTATVWDEPPFDRWSIAEWVLVGLVFAVIAGWNVRRVVRSRERSRWITRIR